MPAPSNVDLLPPEIRSEINRLLVQRVPLDRIVAHLQELYGAVQDMTLPSRSGLGRYAKAKARILRVRNMARDVGDDLGGAEFSKQTSFLLEMLQGHFAQVLELGEDMDGTTTLDAKKIGELARGLKDLMLAMRTNLDFLKDIEERATTKERERAAKALEVVGREKGLSTQTLAAIKAGIFGVKPA